MKLKIMLLLILAIFCRCQLFSDLTRVNPDDYILNYGDVFIIQLLSADTLSIKSPVLPTGALSLYPFADTVMVAGGTLTEAMQKIERKIGTNVVGSRVLIQFAEMGTFLFNVVGAVVRPNTHRTDQFLTLTEALDFCGGLVISASKIITINRNNKMLTFDLTKYFGEKDVSQNPLIMPGDTIIVGYATNYVNVYTNTSSLFALNTVELKQDKMKIRDVFHYLPYNHPWTNRSIFTVIRGEVANYVDAEFELIAGDKLFLSVEEFYVYVTGYVNLPGKYPYNGKLEAEYYLALSGGIRDNGSRSKVYLIRENGKREVYKNQIIEPGDTIDIPESGRSIFVAYLGPFATIVSLTISIYLIAVR